MLLKITKLNLGYISVAEPGYEIESRVEVWINPERVSSIELNPPFYAGYAFLQCGVKQLTISAAEATAIIAHINGATDAAPPAAATHPAPKTTAANLVSMTRDSTQNSGSPFWRCGTAAGFMVNVFKHDDPLKDNFNLFDAAGYAPEMLAMNYGDNITWTRDAIAVELVANGKFWNVVRVETRPDGAMPDEPEPEDDDLDDSDDEGGTVRIYDDDLESPDLDEDDDNG